MPAVWSWFWFLEQAAAGSRMTAEAEQEQLAGIGRSGTERKRRQLVADSLLHLLHSSTYRFPQYNYDDSNNSTKTEPHRMSPSFLVAKDPNDLRAVFVFWYLYKLTKKAN